MFPYIFRYKSYLQTLQTDITGEIDKAALAAKTKLEKRIDREATMNKVMVDKAITKVTDKCFDMLGI